MVVAERQSAGRGRQGRSWVSQPGNLLFSVIFRPSISQLPFISIIGGLAAARAVRKVAALDPRIKWPNDLMLEGRKAAGILAESAIEGESVCYAVLGIGINVVLNAEETGEIADIATSVNAASGRDIPRESLLLQCLLELDSLYRGLPGGRQYSSASPVEDPVEEWKRLIDTLGRRITVTSGTEQITGLALDVDDTGNLLLQKDNDEVITLTAGDITIGSSTNEQS